MGYLFQNGTQQECHPDCIYKRIEQTVAESNIRKKNTDTECNQIEKEEKKKFDQESSCFVAYFNHSNNEFKVFGSFIGVLFIVGINIQDSYFFIICKDFIAIDWLI